MEACSFKNFKRGYLKKPSNDDSAEPPRKQLKWSNIDSPDITEEEYENAVKDLQGKNILI